MRRIRTRNPVQVQDEERTGLFFAAASKTAYIEGYICTKRAARTARGPKGA